MPLVLTHFDNHIGTLTFHHTEKRNCLSTALIQDMLTALDGFEQVAVRVVSLRAATGVRVRSAGHDVRELLVILRDLCDERVRARRDTLEGAWGYCRP